MAIVTYIRTPSYLGVTILSLFPTFNFLMLSMLGSIKVLVGKDDPRDYRGAGVKREMMTAIS